MGIDTLPGRVLGLDLGDVRIGVAVSDPERRLAVPVGTVHVGRPPGELLAIKALIEENDVTLVVLGLPLNMTGEKGARAEHAEGFADALRAVTNIPVEMHDERLSTVQADRALKDAGLTGRQRRAVVDASAAQVILQSWLDSRAGGA